MQMGTVAVPCFFPLLVSKGLGGRGSGLGVGGERERETYEVVQDFVPDDLHHLKRLQRRHAVDEHVAVDADEVLRVEDAVLVLAGRVDNLGRKLLPLVADLLAEGVLDGRVVALDKVPVDVADGEGGFA
jgi:hypothetical protein